MTSAWSQLEQLLTCCVCLDRFRNPKLLPCQHTFCGEPCLEGLVDYVRKQIKCPECRAEHRIPYNGVQSFPNNVTLARFLDLHRGITGEEPEPLPSQMDRCGVCSEKAFCEKCAHCDKKVCEECKEAHLDILRREISRINTQVRRGLTKLTEHLQQTSRSSEKMNINYRSIKEEITESVRRIIKDLKDKETKLLRELDEYVQTEAKNGEKMKEDLDQELVNISSNCELAESHINENEEWTVEELVEYKEIFVKTLDFLRNLDPDASDFARKIKFQFKTDMDALRRSAIDFGELKITSPNVTLSPSESANNLNTLSVPNQSNLLRSQSDHRLAAQFQQRKDSRYLDVGGSQSRLTALTFSDSERDRLERNTSPTRQFGRYGSRYEDRDTRSRYDSALTRGWPRPSDDDAAPTTHFRSRFMRERERNNQDYNEDNHESEYSAHRSVRFQEQEPAALPRPKIFDTEEVTRGPLSGVIKLVDSPKLMERLHQNEVKQKLKEQEEKSAPPPQPPPVSTPVSQPLPRRAPSRQVSEDEIEKQKKANKVAAAATAAAAAAATPQPAPPAPQSPKTTVPQSPVVPESPNRLINRRVTQLQKEDSVNRYSSDSSRRGSDNDDLGDDSDNSSVGRYTRRRAEETESRPVISRQNSGQRQVSNGSDIVGDKNSSPIGATNSQNNETSTGSAAVPVSRAAVSAATAPSSPPITTTATSVSSSPVSAVTTEANPVISEAVVERDDSKDSKVPQDSPACPPPQPSIKYKFVSKAVSSVNPQSPQNLTSSNSPSEAPEARTQRDIHSASARLSAKTPSVTRLTGDVRCDKTDSSGLPGVTSLTSHAPVYASRRSPALTDSLTPIPKASDASTNLLSLSAANSSVNSRGATRLGSPESGVRRVSLEDFRGQERPNYNPYRQANASAPSAATAPYSGAHSQHLSHNLTRPVSYLRAPTTTTHPTTYRQTLSSLGFPDSSNERQIITSSIDWGISVFDYFCYSLGFMVFLTVLLYRSVRSPLGKNPSVDRPDRPVGAAQDRQDRQDRPDRLHSSHSIDNTQCTNRQTKHTIGSDKPNVRTLSTDIDSETSDTNASAESSADSETDSEEGEDEESSSTPHKTNTVSASSGRTTSSCHERQPERSDTAIQSLPASLNTLLTRSAQARQDNLNAISRTDSPNITKYSRQTTLTEDKPDPTPAYYRGRRASDTAKEETPTYTSRRNLSRAATLEEDNDEPQSTPYSRFLSRSRTSSALANKDEAKADDSRLSLSRRPDKYGTTSSSVPSYRSRLAKSKSSHTIAGISRLGPEFGSDK